jgi:hypothetical protein
MHLYERYVIPCEEVQPLTRARTQRWRAASIQSRVPMVWYILPQEKVPRVAQVTVIRLTGAHLAWPRTRPHHQLATRRFDPSNVPSGRKLHG